MKKAIQFGAPGQHPKTQTGTGDVDRDIIVCALEDDLNGVKSALLSDPGCINKTDFSTGNTALHIAVTLGNLTMVDFLLAQPGLDPFLKNGRDLDALDAALTGGHRPIKDRLLSHWARASNLDDGENAAANKSRSNVVPLKPEP